eukprot:Seg94.17 transcript_id=Seg94.17/GoldUCD/mRNA.D3Y31 product=Melanopsin protein_id=Seg94.17/GoldUCD/D3Y31
MSHLDAFRVSLLIFFFTILFLGLFLNISILYSMLTSRKIRSKISNFYLISVITASLISCLTSCPYYITSLLPDLPEVTDETRRKYSPHCNAALVFNYSISFCKILSIMLLSLDRFIAIVWPYLYVEKVTKQRAILSLVYVWLQGIGMVMITPFNKGWVRYIGMYGAACGFKWAQGKYEYILPTIALNIFLPTVIIIATNVKVFAVARAHRRSIRKSTVSFNNSGQAQGKLRLVSTLAQAIILMELSEAKTRSNSLRIHVTNSQAQQLGPQKMQATSSQDESRTEPMKRTGPFGPTSTKPLAGTSTHGEKPVRRDHIFKKTRIQPVIATKYKRTMSPVLIYQTRTEPDKRISKSRLADREVVLDVRMLKMNSDEYDDEEATSEVEAPVHKTDNFENYTVNREEPDMAKYIADQNQRKFEQDTEHNSEEPKKLNSTEKKTEMKKYPHNVDTINNGCTIDVEECSEEKACVYDLLKTSAGKQVDDIIITINALKEGSSNSGDLEKNEKCGAEIHKSKHDNDAEITDDEQEGYNQRTSNDDNEKSSVNNGIGDCENLNRSKILPVDDQIIEHQAINKVAYEECSKYEMKTTASENQQFENKDSLHSKNESVYGNRAGGPAKTTTEGGNQIERNKNSSHSKRVRHTEHPILERCPIARFKSRNRIRNESVKRDEILNLHSFNEEELCHLGAPKYMKNTEHPTSQKSPIERFKLQNEISNKSSERDEISRLSSFDGEELCNLSACRYLKNTEHPTPQKSPIERFKLQNKLSNNTSERDEISSLHSFNGEELCNLSACRYLKNTELPTPQKSPIERFKLQNKLSNNTSERDEISSLHSFNGEELCNLSACRYLKNTELPTPQKSPIERFKLQNKLSNNTSERDEISSLHSFKGEEFSNLTASKRLKILSDPLAYNRQSKRLLMRNIQPSLLLSTVLLVFFFIITWLPFALSRVVRLSSKGKIILPEAAITVTAAVTNLDIILNPIIILSTRKGLRRTLIKRMSSLFIKRRPTTM